MIEKHIVLEDIDLVTFYGVNNVHLQMIKALYPKLRIVARGNIVKVMGDEEEMCAFEENIAKMQEHCAKYNSLNEEVILQIVRGEHPTGHAADGTAICYSITGKPIAPRSENQKTLVDAYYKNDMIFAIGPAGSGKTYVSIALAVRALKNKEIRKIILCRPAVEAGEKLGFLPGDMREKIDPYLQPLYDALQDMIPAQKLTEHMEQNVILDEAQNTTTQQIKMFLTRMGQNTKMIITGDLTQIDLPRNVKSGLKEAKEVLKDVKGIAFVEMDERDIVRHKLVTRIVNAYHQYESETKYPLFNDGNKDIN